MAEFNQQFTGGAVDLGALAQQAEARREMESTAFEPFITVTERDVEANAVSFRFLDGSQINGVPVEDAVQTITEWVTAKRNEQPSEDTVAIRN